LDQFVAPPYVVFVIGDGRFRAPLHHISTLLRG